MKLFSEASRRNEIPIGDVLVTTLPARGVVLELASGSGQHVVAFARRLPDRVFRPSDPSAEARASIDAYVAESGLANVEPARAIDVCVPGWEEPVDAILNINMVHIAPWAASLALFRGAARCLGPGAPLVLYGPYRFGGVIVPSNAAFDEDLRSRNPLWGVREYEDLRRAAAEAGFDADPPIALPANNHVLVFRRRAREARHGGAPPV